MSSVASTIATYLADKNVNTVFGLLGEANLALMLALRAAGIEWVPLRREDSVIAAADGHAQGTGGLGVGVVSQGPALANSINPLIGAAKGRTPLLILSGAIAPECSDEPQWLDQRRLIQGTNHVSYRGLSGPEETKSMLADALRTAIVERTPVVLEVPTHLQTLAVPSTPGPSEQLTYLTPPSPNSARITTVAEALVASDRPLILAGRGAIHARESLIKLASDSGALLGTTLLAKGLFDGESAALGVVGGFSTKRGRDLSESADLVIAFGAGLNRFTDNGGRLSSGARVIRVDTNADLVQKADLLGDSREVADLLLAAMSVRQAQWHPAPGESDVISDDSDERGLDLRTVARWLDAVIDHDRALSLDLGYFTSEASLHIELRQPNRQAFSLHFGSIGLGLATAIGLSSAHPTIPTVAALGDGGLMSSLQELESLSRLQLPVIVAVFNDSAYGVEVYELEHLGEDGDQATFPTVNFASVARSLGIQARTIASTFDLTLAIPIVKSRTGPLLLDFRLRRGVITRWYRDNVHPNFSRQEKER